MSRNIWNSSSLTTRNINNASASEVVVQADATHSRDSAGDIDLEADDLVLSGNLTVAGSTTLVGAVTLPTGINVDTIDEKSSGVGVTVEQVLIKDDDITLDNTNINDTNLSVILRDGYSAGVISGFGITDNSDGTVDVASGVCTIRTTNSDTGELGIFSIALTSALALTDTNNNYVYVDYNGGSPQLAATTTGSTIRNNENDAFELYEIYRSGTALTITSHCQFFGNGIKRLNRFLYQKHSHTRTEGLILGEVGTRKITVTAGSIWVKLNEISITAINTNVSGSFSRFYYNGSAWVEQTTQTAWDELQYNNTASGLVTLTNNRYSYQEFFIIANDTLISVYGDAQYVSLSGAESANVLSTLPDVVGEHGSYIGRIVFQKSDATAQSILNPFESQLNFSTSSDHGALTGLSDDDHTQYVTLANRTGESLDIDDIVVTNTVDTPKVSNAGDITIDCINAGSDSTLTIENSDGTYKCDVVIEGDLSATNTTTTSKVITGIIQPYSGTGSLVLAGNSSNGDAKTIITRTANGDINMLRFRDATAGSYLWSFRNLATEEDLILYNESTTKETLRFDYTNDKIAVYSLTASRLMSTDASKNMESVSDMTTWIAGGDDLTAVRV